MREERLSRFGQIKVYVGKCFRMFRSEKQWKNLISTAIIMGIISLVTSPEMFTAYKATKNGAFAILCACIWIGLFNSVQSICRERDIIKREHRTGLHISSYLLAHVVYEWCLCAVESLIILLILCLKNITHLPEEGLVFFAILDIYLTLLAVVFASDMLALLISCIVKTTNSAMTVMPFVLIVQLVMSGTVFELNGVTELISYLTISKWGLNGIVAIANTSSRVLLQYDFAGGEGADPEAATLLGVWLLLDLFAIVYIAVAILFLRRVDKDQR